MSESLRLRPPYTQQPSLPGLSALDDALGHLSDAGAEARGAVFTRREVVEFILDLVGYVVGRPLYRLSLLEPSFGDGDFLLVAVERLLRARHLQDDPVPATALRPCIRAVELHRASFESTRAKLIETLRVFKISEQDAVMLADEWLICGDYLLTELPFEFDFVVGNPPYIRQELIPDALLDEYRSRYSTVFDRADIYIPFIERSVMLISPQGKLGIICADRWVKNRYGGPLRQLLARRFSLLAYVDMVDTPAFHSNVIAYPAIFVVGRKKAHKTRIARRPKIDKQSLTLLAQQLTCDGKPDPDGPVVELTDVARGTRPWILERSARLALVRRLEHEFPRIEEAGCKVGIGVATGADKAFIGPYRELNVEDDRKLPLVTTRDIETGKLRWKGLGVINPFAPTGKLVDLSMYPRLKYYLEARKQAIAGRHVARKTPANWYRTIDRIYPELAATPKLLIPDIKGEPNIVHEDGRLYPHHNLYYLTSREWDLRALRAILLSGIAKLFIATYSTPMRGGYFRFQAQYLRRIRLPRWSSVSATTIDALSSAADKDDVDSWTQLAFSLYRFTADERAVLRDMASAN